ncbi:MAG: hypothetical protein P0Y49_04815 [Candidatus Pedobacter colombiensis]|uniref:HNH endonuclease n=1 Tax=Candidatus Pedobacter colombiensis TaxID=3121371 RepID=A0AAJ5WAN0_9SPHI|nr:hypothetical protein [Pedobacter sp.]WEK20458.1 MAG: hypothetical protein P0Y49_04815 [Pedobacter sp.]
MNIEQFLSEERSRVMNLFSSSHKTGFLSKHDLSDWFVSQIQQQNFKCYYCETSIFDIKKLIGAKLLTTRKIRYGERGPILEIDKKLNGLGYLKTNCVLACYYCNNDKSYTLNADQYKTYFGPARNVFFKVLLNELEPKTLQ